MGTPPFNCIDERKWSTLWHIENGTLTSRVIGARGARRHREGDRLTIRSGKAETHNNIIL